jgi:hypothetical protein
MGRNEGDRYGAKAGSVAAPVVGERRGLRTLAQPHPESNAGGRIKSKTLSKGKAKAKSRVPVTASMAWPNFYLRDGREVD